LVIGVNSQIASDAASVDGSQPGSTGVGFAIASNTLAQAIKTIEAGKGVSYASATHSREEAEGAARSPYGSQSPYGPYGEAEVAGQTAEAGTEAGSGSGVSGASPAEAERPLVIVR
jgi:S1-C subfamily serine protease